ncbi:hypothetical protein LUZ63_000861 [Rhynchospora breviuscula]|uniref:Uncharacterized protein n=1 Tax=Rhynchospora breviuscula TaxID=2022672 RepID=A0A9Q0HWH4_9POAL|nr:hypothetical protein LUZ63_000861 [Rhynchospora breviuscula]
MSMDQSYRIICRTNPDYSLAIRGGILVFVITNPCDRFQHWFKEERHGITIKDSEGQPAFALVNKATGEAIAHCPISTVPVPLIRYSKDSCDKSVLWTVSKVDFDDYRHIRRVDDISVFFTAHGLHIHDGHVMDLYSPKVENYGQEGFLWKMLEVLPSNPISLFRPSQHTVRIHCRAKLNYNLTIAKDGITVMLVPSNCKDKYQHWIKETACGVPVKGELEKESFAIVNKATGKAIKHGFGSGYLVQVVPFNRNYMDASLLWTESGSRTNGFREIRMGSNISMALHAFDSHIVNCPLVGISNRNEKGTQYFQDGDQEWKIVDYE